MSHELDTYYRRVEFCAQKIVAYVDSRDQVKCREHDWVSYDLCLAKDGTFKRVCLRCSQTILPEVKKAEETVTSRLLDQCGEVNCYREADKTKTCSLCHLNFCPEHMSGMYYCNTCSAELDEDAREHTDFPMCC